jgi:hypothetical protein
MRYWAYLVGKLVAAAGFLYCLLAALNAAWKPDVLFQAYSAPRFAYDLPYTTAVFIWFLICAGVGYLVIRDQRYRCRVCLRRLRMPVVTGSWSRMLQFGRPRVEYICTYGHGTLQEDELQISGLEKPRWTRHSGDVWEELFAAKAEGEDKRP